MTWKFIIQCLLYAKIQSSRKKLHQYPADWHKLQNQGQGGQTWCLYSRCQVFFFFLPQFHYRPRLFEQVNDTWSLQWVRNEVRSVQPVSKTRKTLLTLVAQNTHWGTTQWHLYSLPLKTDLQVRQLKETIVAEKNSTTLWACGWLNHVCEGTVGFLGLGNDTVTDRTEGTGTSTPHMIMSQPTRASHSL